MEYTRRDLALAYLNAHPMPEHFTPDPESLHARLKTYHQQLLRGLEQLFDVDLASDRVLQFFFRSVARSYRGNTYPLSGLIEGGLLLNRIEGSGALELCGELARRHKESQELHVDLTVKILELLKPNTGETFSTEDLATIGVDDVEPTDPDGDWL